MREITKARFNAYKNRASVAGLTFGLTYAEFMAHWQKPCSYCGVPIPTIGLDRVDNALGYMMGNIVPCCFTCNVVKGSDTREVFLARCRRIAELHPC
jgi:hypothetical protein